MKTKKLKIGSVELKNNILLAPMAGYTDVAFRSLASLFGAGLTTTEMVSAKALSYKNEKTNDLLITEPNESPKAVQLFGHEPEVFEEVIKSGVLDKFDIIDINMGCPAPKIVSNAEGSALMCDIALAEKIIKSAVNATKKPVTVKFRAGFDKGHINAVEFAKMCERAGASAITVHGRTRDEFYSGKADKDIIKQCVEAVKIPVIANGDVVSPESAQELLEYTGAAGIMIGRGALGNLELFAQITKIEPPLTKAEQIDYIAKTLSKYYSPNMVLNTLRAHLVHYVKGSKFSTKLKVELLTINDLNVLITRLKEVLA